MIEAKLYLVAWLWGFWGLYVLVMGLYRAHLTKRLRGFVAVLAAPFVAIGYVVDVVSNLVVATAIFLELPREWLVTTRLSRYIEQDRAGRRTWRSRIATYVCDHLLDPFDPTGDHC